MHDMITRHQSCPTALEPVLPSTPEPARLPTASPCHVFDIPSAKLVDLGADSGIIVLINPSGNAESYARTTRAGSHR